MMDKSIILSNCCITTTGIGDTELSTIEDAVLKLGGVFTRVLDSEKCTHLLSRVCGSEKYEVILEPDFIRFSPQIPLLGCSCIKDTSCSARVAISVPNY